MCTSGNDCQSGLYCLNQVTQGGKGTVAKADYACILGPRESSLAEPDVDPKGNEQEAAELSHASVRERHCNDTDESSAREENARGEARDAGLHL